MFGIFSSPVSPVQVEQPKQVWKTIRAFHQGPKVPSLWEDEDSLYYVKALPKPQPETNLTPDEFINTGAQPTRINTEAPKSLWNMWRNVHPSHPTPSLWENDRALFYVKTLQKEKNHGQPMPQYSPSTQGTQGLTIIDGAILIPANPSNSPEPNPFNLNHTIDEALEYSTPLNQDNHTKPSNPAHHGHPSNDHHAAHQPDFLISVEGMEDIQPSPRHDAQAFSRHTPFHSAFADSPLNQTLLPPHVPTLSWNNVDDLFNWEPMGELIGENSQNGMFSGSPAYIFPESPAELRQDLFEDSAFYVSSPERSPTVEAAGSDTKTPTLSAPYPKGKPGHKLAPEQKKQMLELLSEQPPKSPETVSERTNVPLRTVKIYRDRLESGLAKPGDLLIEKKSLSQADKEKLFSLIRKNPNITPGEVNKTMDVHPRVVWYYKQKFEKTPNALQSPSEIVSPSLTQSASTPRIAKPKKAEKRARFATKPVILTPDEQTTLIDLIRNKPNISVKETRQVVGRATKDHVRYYKQKIANESKQTAKRPELSLLG